MTFAKRRKNKKFCIFFCVGSTDLQRPRIRYKYDITASKHSKIARKNITCYSHQKYELELNSLTYVRMLTTTTLFALQRLSKVQVCNTHTHDDNQPYTYTKLVTISQIINMRIFSGFSFENFICVRPLILTQEYMSKLILHVCSQSYVRYLKLITVTNCNLQSINIFPLYRAKLKTVSHVYKCLVELTTKTKGHFTFLVPFSKSASSLKKVSLQQRFGKVNSFIMKTSFLVKWFMVVPKVAFYFALFVLTRTFKRAVQTYIH